MTLVGEHGAELVHLPGGSMVLPNHATRHMDGGGAGVAFYGDMHFHGVQNPQDFMRQMREYMNTMTRR